MKIGVSRAWLRRLLAQLTTPLVVALLWVASINDGDDLGGDLWAAIGLCYLGWLLIGAPGVLFRPRARPPSVWGHAVQGALLGALPFLPGALIRGPESWFGIAGFCMLAGAVAALWYWLCAYWQPFRSEFDAASA
jgi:hypothetical protein